MEMNEPVVRELAGRYYGCNCQAGEDLRDEIYQQVGMWVACRGVRGMDIDDVTTDAVCRVLLTKGRGSQFDTARGSSFGAWLRRLVRNEVAEFHRRRQRIQQHEEHEAILRGEDPPTSIPSIEERLVRQEAQDAQVRALRAFLAYLTQRQREVMEVILERLAAQGEMPSNQEIAEELDMSVGNVAVVRHQAIRTLRGFWARPSSQGD
jgi:RNA polymerase sigma factor (sigma-70 family)